MPLINPHALGADRIAAAEANLRRTIVSSDDPTTFTTTPLVVDGLPYQQFYLVLTVGSTGSVEVTPQFTVRTRNGNPEWLNFSSAVMLASGVPTILNYQLDCHAIRVVVTFPGDATLQVVLSGTAT